MSCYLSEISYSAPKWAEKLKNIPKKRILLAALPTPIHEWKIQGVPNNFKVFIKRDDLTGNGLSGNKIRKLEFLLGDAVMKGCKSVITCGGIQSNHCRATAIAARELGLDCHLLLRSDSNNSSVVSHPGNLLPSIFCNSFIYLIPKSSKYLNDIKPKQDSLSLEIKKKTGSPAYSIPVGGSNSVGVFGYIQAWEEMMKEQNLTESFDDLVITCGSGGSIAGLAIGNYLTGNKLKLHAITVCDDQAYFYGHVNEMLVELGLNECKAEDLVDVIDGYKGAGYGTSTSEDRDFYIKVASKTGIFLDPVYTGKTVRGMLTEMRENPSRFRGNRVLFIHTGGMLSLYDGAMQDELSRKFQENTFVWTNEASSDYRPIS